MFRNALFLPILLFVACILSLFAGSTALGPSDFFAALWPLNAGPQDSLTTVSSLILWDIRLPRILLAALVGWGLGLSGAAIQGLMRNPLAEPMVLGAGNMAALGAVLVIYIGLQQTISWAVPLAASLFAFVAVIILFALTRRHTETARLILCGFAISALAGALISLALNLSPNVYAALEITFWLLGSLENRGLPHFWLALPLIAIGSAFLISGGRGYATLTLGDEAARSLGLMLGRLHVQTIFGIAIISGAVVAVGGVIGFVGLVVPHMVRPFFGYHPQKILIPSGWVGALIVVLADSAVRMIPTTFELKLGVMTALLGVPFFLILILRSRFLR